MKLAVLILLGLLAGCAQEGAPVLSVQVRGCIVYWDRPPRPVCATLLSPGEKEKLLLSIAGTPLAAVRVTVNREERYSGSIPIGGRLFVELEAERTEGTLEVRLGGLPAQSRYQLDVRTQNPFPAARAVLDEIEKQDRDRWPALVQAALDQLDQTTRSWSAAERAYLLSKLGATLRRLIKDLPDEQAAPPLLRTLAIQTLERAIGEAQEARLYSEEVFALRRLNILLARGEAPDPRQAIRLLHAPGHQAAYRAFAAESTEIYVELSRLYEEVGELSLALDMIEQALTLNVNLKLDAGDYVAFLIQKANILQYLNSSDDALRLSQEALRILRGQADASACSLLTSYSTLGWIHFLAQQAGHREATPKALLQQAVGYIAACTQKSARLGKYDGGLARLNLARAELAEAERSPAGSAERQRALAAAAQLHGEAAAVQVSQPDYYLDVHDLAGRMALLRGHGSEALAAFQRLEELTATKILTPLFRWEALVGQAEALELQRRRPEALAAYARAAALIERVANGMPLVARRQLFVAQFEEGTARYLELLLSEPGRERDATILAVIRHARTLALRSHVQPVGSGASADDTSVGRYFALHEAKDAAARALHDAPEAERAAAQARLEELDVQLHGVLAALYTGQAGVPSAALRGPEAGELLVGCYPLPRHEERAAWICAAADSQGVYVHRTAGFVTDAQAAAAELLAALQIPIRRASRLRLLTYGGMREVAWEQVPLAGQPLSAYVTVVYGADLARLPPPQGAQQALVVLDPEQDLSGGHRTEAGLVAELQQQGYRIELYRGAPRRGRHLLSSLGERWLTRQTRPALAPPILSSLPASGLFIYYGHAQASLQGGWDSHLRFAEGGTIAARDIMALPSVPRRVLLIGCETAVSDRGAPVDEVGLAQAFLLRGSEEVLATTRKVPDVLAEQLIAALRTRGAFAASAPPLAQSLRGALVELRQRSPRADWDAFRVYQP